MMMAQQLGSSHSGKELDSSGFVVTDCGGGGGFVVLVVVVVVMVVVMVEVVEMVATCRGYLGADACALLQDVSGKSALKLS